MNLHSSSSVNDKSSTPKDPLYKILYGLRSHKLWKEKKKKKKSGGNKSRRKRENKRGRKKKNKEELNFFEKMFTNRKGKESNPQRKYEREGKKDKKI